MISRQAGWPEGTEADDALRALNKRIGIPSRLSESGVSQDGLHAIATQALQDNAHKTNPRPMGHADYMALLKSAY